MRKTLRVDIDLRAYKKGNKKLEDSICFLHKRLPGSFIGRCMESYFVQHVLPKYDEDDTDHDYPTFRITLYSWDKAISILSEKKELIRYLAGYITTPFSFDKYHICRHEFRELGDIDITKLQEFDRWFTKELHLSSTFPKTIRVSPLDERGICLIVRDAYTLMLWFELDKLVREYLLDDSYEVYLRIGNTFDFIHEGFI